MYKRLTFSVNIIVFICFVLSLPAFAKITAYIRYNIDLSPDIAADLQFNLQSWPGDGSHIIISDAGRPDANGALVAIPPSASVYWTNNPDGIWQILDPNQGTIEMWIAPNWNGTNQGGPGVGGSGATQALFNIGDGNLFEQGLHFVIFNNNNPDDGGQLFVFWIDSYGIYRDLNSSILQPGVGDMVLPALPAQPFLQLENLVIIPQSPGINSGG